MTTAGTDRRSIVQNPELSRPHHGPDARRFAFNADWLFGGAVADPPPPDHPDDTAAAAAADPSLDDSHFEPITLPHTVVPLSWNQWDNVAWEKVWSYRKHFDLPEDLSGRTFLDFEAANVTATVTVNGTRIGRHFGGYLPFSFEITDVVAATGNIVAVLVDSRFDLNVPPNIPAPVHAEEVDFWQPGGIHGSVTLRIEPTLFIADVAATVRSALEPAARRVEIVAHVDAGVATTGGVLDVSIIDASGVVTASATTAVPELPAGTAEIALVVDGLEEVELWDVDAPHLYGVVTALRSADGSVHEHRTRIGFREARFELDGFFLNGRRRYLFGANRHQHYPFAGFAMPARVQRRDAELLRHELNCIMVRCSHYPQFSAFLDACDEIGLLVWEEAPGWQYVGDHQWQDRAKDAIRAMIVRDRNRPSVIIWAARLNETPDHPDFYSETEAMVKALDDTRATSGTSHGPYHDTPFWQHDVFAYDDYSIDVLPDGDHRPTLRPPRTDRPYLIGETVTSWSSPARLYRRADGPLVQQHQAMDYAYVHEIARADPRYTGVLAWSAIDYQAGHIVNHRGMKTSGLLDVFRVPKPGAAMYRAQIEPTERIVLEPAFTWDPPVERQFRPGNDNRTVPDGWGPGERAVIFTNCDRIEVHVGGQHRATARPSREEFPHLVTPPTIVDLRVNGREGADLVLEGYLDDALVITRRYSGNRAADVLCLRVDDPAIVADGVDATRVELAIVDQFGEPRGSSQVRVALELRGPGRLIGEPVFDFSETGAVGAVWVRSRAQGDTGLATVIASHPRLGAANVTIEMRAAGA
jgi:beta-galactosidase